MLARSGIFSMPAAAAVPAAACTDATRPVAGAAPVDGLRHGPQRIAHFDGSVEEGCFLVGQLSGEWVRRHLAGRILVRERWCRGREAGSQRLAEGLRRRADEFIAFADLAPDVARPPRLPERRAPMPARPDIGGGKWE